MEDINAVAQHAMQAFNANAFEQAFELAASVLSVDPNHQLCLQIQGRIHNRDKEWAKALPKWRGLARLRPDWPEGHLQVLRCLHRTESFAEAVEVAALLLALQPDNVEAHQIRTQSLSRLQQNNELITAYLAFITGCPKLVDPRIQLGRLYRKLGMLPEAVSTFHAILSVAPDNEEAARTVSALIDNLISNARNYWLTGQNVAASQAVRGVLAVDPGNVAATEMYQLLISPALTAARAAQQENNVTALLQHAEELLSIAPDHIEGLGIMAGALARARRWQEAAAVWERLAARIPASVEAHLQMARCHERVQALDLALIKYSDVIALDPSHAEAGTAAARLSAVMLGQARQKSQAGELEEAQRLLQLASRGRFENATAMAVSHHIAHQWLRLAREKFKAEAWAETHVAARNATSLDSGLIEAWQLYARSAHRVRDWQGSLTAWAVLQKADSAAFEPRLQLGRCHRRVGDNKQALHWFKMALTVNPDHAEAKEAVAELSAA